MQGSFGNIHPSISSAFGAVDFFCGAGGMTHGLIGAGINVLGGIDNDEQCRLSYESNNSPAKFLRYDISALTCGTLEEELKIKADDPSLIFAGCTPCQYWSKVRTSRVKSEATAFLLTEFQRFIEFFRPGFIIMENVPGLETNTRSCLPNFLEFLNKSHYNYEHGIINAGFYGVPQHRKRFLLIAAKHLAKVSLPPADSYSRNVSSVLGPNNGFTSIPAGHIDETDFMHSTASLSTKNLRRIRATPHDGGTRAAWKDDSALQIKAYKQKDRCFADVYGRMFWEKPSPTITTRFISLSNGRFGHPDEDRAISLREGASLQSFPRNYRFFGSGMGAIAKQIGNAVPPELAKRIGEHILRMAADGSI